MHICSIVGARPQFVKAAVVSHALKDAGIRESLIHTGQHYDGDMSDVFFNELGIPAPERNLGVGSGSHADQTGRMMVALEQAFQELQPNRVLVYGDTNSTLAAALVAAKLHIPLDHVEAGLRSFNRHMPEEINRIVTDRLSDLLFCPTATAVAHLAAEGRTEGVHLTGDVMLDATLYFSERAAARHPLSSLTEVPSKAYSVATIHRAENTDHPARLQTIIRALGHIGEPVLLPLHPRTRGRLEGLQLPETVHVLQPVPYLSMLTLVRNARRVFTDSGGLQKEAVWLGTPCITLREETEWTETTAGGWNRITGANEQAILEAARAEPTSTAPVFGTGAYGLSASDAIAGLVRQSEA